MDQVEAHSKDYEFLVKKLSRSFADVVAGIEIVKQFIAEKNLIIYGGSAIDYALRLKGDKIYPDDTLVVPDLDMYSPDSVADSYKLADLLYNAGFEQARAICAEHIETMRVDVVDNNFIADISYRPQAIFDTLPYLNYNGMRVIHPLFQRIDMHAALSFPFDYVPREVFFARWQKDITRFNILDKYYPVEVPEHTLELRNVTVSAQIKKYPITGFLAYAIYCEMFTEIMGAAPDIFMTRYELQNDEFTFATFDRQVDIMHFDTHDAAKNLKLTDVKHYYPYINLRPECARGSLGAVAVVINSCRNRLLAINSAQIKSMDSKLRIVNIQVLLNYFISGHFIYITQKQRAALYLKMYASLLQMVRAIDAAKTYERGAPWEAFFPSVDIYGNANISISAEYALNRIHVDIDGAKPFKQPINYNVKRSRDNMVPPPAINIALIDFFKQSGEPINLPESATN